MSDAPTIAVCIANYNGELLLRDCLDSVLTQVAGQDVEILVHDDASTDASLDVLARDYPQVRVLRSEVNVGFCAANNRMAAATRAEWLLFLNNDAALEAGALDALRQATLAPTLCTLTQVDWNSGAIVDRGARLDFALDAVANHGEGHPIGVAAGACLLVPRAAWDAVGGFPEWFESIAEDTYLCCAARLAGYELRIASGSYRHRQGTSFGGAKAVDGRLDTTRRRRRLSERNRLRVIAICTPTWLVFPWLAAAAAAVLAEGVLLSIALRDGTIGRDIHLAAVQAAWRDRDRICGERSRVQSSRTLGLRAYLAPFVVVPQKLRLLLRYGLPRIRG